VRLRNLLLVGALGLAAAALPAMASSETTPSVEATSTGMGYYGETFAWTPPQTTVAAGGSVTFSTGSTGAPHGIVWTSSVKPTCASSVPVWENAEPREHWSGACTFTQPGVYSFRCIVHHEMTGTITVTAAGVTTTTTTTPAPTTSTPTTTPTTPSTTTTTPKPTAAATRAKKLAKALKVCKKKPKDKRAACIKRAHKRYGPVKKK
jgi:plastocyanin